MRDQGNKQTVGARPTVLVTAHDPGGGEAVAQVAKMLSEHHNCNPISIIHPMCQPVFAQLGVRIDHLVSWNSSDNKKEATNLVRQANPALVVAGTSMGDTLDKLIIRVAKRENIPTLSIVDFWTNYWPRFTLPGEPQSYRLNSLPDAITVINERSRSDMTTAGFPPDKLVVTGQPRFDWLKSFTMQQRKEMRERWSKAFGISATDLWILFLSQPLGSVYEGNPKTIKSNAFNEETTPYELLTVLEEQPLVPGRKNILLIRYHPKEDRSSFESLRKDARIPTILSQDPTTIELLSMSDLVVGMTTVLLVDAYIMGRPVLSLQLGLEESKTFKFGGLDNLPIVRKPVGLRKALLGTLMTDSVTGSVTREPDLDHGTATSNIATLAQELMKLPRI